MHVRYTENHMTEKYTTLGERFCRALVDSSPTAQARTLLLMELAKWAGKTIYLPRSKRNKRRAEAARNLLDNNQTPAAAALIIH